MVPLRFLMVGMVAGCGLFAYVSYTQQQAAANRSFLDQHVGNGPLGMDEWAAKMPDLTQGLQLMEQRLMYLEVQIQELGRSHSTSTSLLLRPTQRLLSAQQGKGSAVEALSSYRVSATRFASASTLSETEANFPAALAIDQDERTRMACKGCVWTGDLGKVVILFTVSVIWETCDCKDDSAAKLEVATLPDGPWQLYSNAGGFSSFGGRTRRSHVMMAEARYIRISMTETSPTGFYSIWEVSVKIEADAAPEHAKEAQASDLPAPEKPAGLEPKRPAPVQKPPAPEAPRAPAPTPPPPPEEDPGLFRTDNKCGKRVPMLPGGGPVQCNPTGIFPCCSALGWCGSTAAHCNCPACVDYKTAAKPNVLPSAASLGETSTGSEASSEVVVVVVIPFRDRETHLEKFKPWWAKFANEGIQPRKVDRWEIYLGEQFDADSFNRGWNFNIGLAVASGQTSACEDITDAMRVPFKCAVIQDIDYLPEPGVDYSECAVPMQLSSEIDRYDWKTPYLQSAGGIVTMNLGHWQQINGFSNDYFGWGGEDDELHHRLRLTGLLYGDCHPFCKPNDPAKGKVGLSIKRPPAGHGRFSGKYMHSANHTKRITDHKAYQQNVKLLQQIQAGQPRWRSDGLSNLAFRIVSYEKDTTYSKEYGITYHHVKVRRGRDAYDPRSIQLAAPISLCSATNPGTAGWKLGSLGEIPWDLAALRKRFLKLVEEYCISFVHNAAHANFILVDRRYHYAKLLSDENPNMLVAFYRGLHDPLEDGLIIADLRSPAEIRKAFDAVHARVNPPTEYTICTSKLGNGELKYSMHQGPACAGGWDKLPGGTFWAFADKKEGMQPISFCDNSRYWVQRIVSGETCEKEWGGLKWHIGGTFWVPSGKQFCVGTKGSTMETPYSMALPESQCSKAPFEHQFNFGTETYNHKFGSFTLCIGRKGDVSRVAPDPHCKADGFQRRFGFRVRVPGSAGNLHSQEFCVVKGKAGDEILSDCSSGKGLAFSVPVESESGAYKIVCSGPSLADPSQNLIGIGDECQDGPGKTVDVKQSFRASSIFDVAASTPSGGDAYPLYTLVDEAVACTGLFCKNAIACAERRSSPSEPCTITASQG